MNMINLYKTSKIITDEESGTKEGCPFGFDKNVEIPKCCAKCPFGYAESLNLEKGFVDCDADERMPGKDLNLGQPFPEYPTLWQGFNTIELGRGFNHGWGYTAGYGTYDSGFPMGVIAENANNVKYSNFSNNPINRKYFKKSKKLSNRI